MTPTDRDLMLAAARGDVEKFGVLFDRYHQRLFEFFYRWSGDASSSEDLVQDVFFRLMKYRRTFGEESDFRAWMYKVARTARIDRFKKVGEATMLREGREADEPKAQERAPDRVLEDSEQAELLRRALLRLPEEKRELLILARYQEMKYDQIADLLDIEVGAVKVRVHRAMIELREIVLEMSAGYNPCNVKKPAKSSRTT